MTLEEFLTTTARRLPTAAELLAVCDELGIGFGQAADGKPVLKYGGDVKEEALALVGILRREPWRTQVIAARGLADAPPPAPEPAPSVAVKEFLWRDGHLYRQPPEEAESTPAGAFWWKWSGETVWQVVPGREEFAQGHEPPEV